MLFALVNVALVTVFLILYFLSSQAVDAYVARTKDVYKRQALTTEERFAQKRKKLQQKLEKLDQQEQRTLRRERAHDEQIARDLAGVPGHFAHGLNFYKLFWVFFLCCFLGVAIETVFCFIASGHLSQRTGLVWGPFNLIYGIGAVLLTVCLHPFIGKSDRWIFVGGSVIGGAFEYFCSWLQETVLGTVSWDYTCLLYTSRCV